MKFDDIHKFMKSGRLHKVYKAAGVDKYKVRKDGKQERHRSE